jgi:thiamine monophosphate synthase
MDAHGVLGTLSIGVPTGIRTPVTAVKDRTRRFDVIASVLQDQVMDNPKRATVYFSADVHKALRLRAAAADRSISDIVNDAVRIALAEDATAG